MLKNVATGVNIKNLLLTQYSYFQPAHEEAKHFARIFITYFESIKLKSETRELGINVFTGYNFF